MIDQAPRLKKVTIGEQRAERKGHSKILISRSGRV